MASKIKIRRTTAALFPVLDDGEPGYQTDTGKLYVGMSGTNVPVSGGATGATGASGSITGLPETIPGMIEAPVNKTYTLVLSALYGCTINYFKAQTTSGTLTAKLQIGGVDVTGSSISVISASVTTGTCSGSNTVVAGNLITMVVTAVSLPADFSFIVQTTRT
jgi:hypothetical protein